jgi:uncharacterized membrane protein (DUF441 family)
MGDEKLAMAVGSVLLFVSLVLGLFMLATLSSGSTNPKPLLTLHVHGIGLGIALLTISVLLSYVSRYAALKRIAAVFSSAGAVLFPLGLAMRLAGDATIFSTAVEILGASLFIGGLAAAIAVFAER